MVTIVHKHPTIVQIVKQKGIGQFLLLILTVVFGGMYVNVGVQHFTNTVWFEPIVPAILGDAAFWVYLTGVIEIALGIGLIIPHNSTSSRAVERSVSRCRLLGQPQHVGQQHRHWGQHIRRFLAGATLGRPNRHDRTFIVDCRTTYRRANGRLNPHRLKHLK